MKKILLAAAIFVSVQAQSQTLKIIVKDDQGNLIPAAISGIASFPIAVNANKQVIDLSQYGIKLNAKLILSATPTNVEDKRKYPVAYSNPRETRVVSGEKTVNFQFKKPASNTDSYIRGIVKTEVSALKNTITVTIKEKDGSNVLATTADADGYFEIKIPLSKWLTNHLETAHVKFTDSLKKMDELILPVDLNKSQFDYWIDGLMKKKNTKLVIAGKVQMPDNKPRETKMTLRSNEEELPVTDLIIDSAGNFSFTIDTAVYDPAREYQFIFRTRGMKENTTSFQPRSIRSLFLVNIETLPRGKHAVNAGITAAPDELYLVAGYCYHPSFGENHFAFGVEAGYCGLKKESPPYPTLDHKTSTRVDTFKGLLFAALAKYYYFPYNEKKLVNPFASISLNFSPSNSLLQPRLSAGIICFVRSYYGVSAEASVAYTSVKYDAVDFRYTGDAGYEEKNTGFWNAYGTIRLYFYIPQK